MKEGKSYDQFITSDTQVCQELIRLLRVQRHDFINHMQVIHAMLQLGKLEKAKEYIENLAKNPSLLTDALQVHIQQSKCSNEYKPDNDA